MVTAKISQEITANHPYFPSFPFHLFPSFYFCLLLLIIVNRKKEWVCMTFSDFLYDL